MSDDTQNNESNSSAKPNIWLTWLLDKLLQITTKLASPPTEEDKNLSENVREFLKSLTDLLVSSTLEGKLPSGLLWNVNFLSTIFVIDDADTAIRVERHFVTPNDSRVVLHLKQLALGLLNAGKAMPTTALYIDKAVVAGQGYKALLTLQKLKERCLALFPDDQYAPNEFPLVDPLLGPLMGKSVIDTAKHLLYRENEKVLTELFPDEQVRTVAKIMSQNPEFAVEKLREAYAPQGIEVSYTPTFGTDKTAEGGIVYEAGHYNVLSVKVAGGMLNFARLNKYVFPTTPTLAI